MNSPIATFVAIATMIFALDAIAVPRETAIKMCDAFADNHPEENRDAFIRNCMSNMSIDSPAPKYPQSTISSNPSSVVPERYYDPRSWSVATALAVLVLGLVIYFLPTAVAVANKKANRVAIFVLNLFLGWTYVGWVLSLVWATMRTPERPTA